jgi:hypothetical protein
MFYKWLNVAGLVFDLVGAVFLAYGLIISKKQAIELGVFRLCSKLDEENLKIPTVQDRVRQSRNAMIGLAFLVVGFVLQIIGNWPR